MTDFLVKTSGQPLGKEQVVNNKVKTLMLLHGWGMNSYVWEPIREVLESKYHILWIDLPGHGFNRHIKAQSLDNMVELIAHSVAKNTLDNIHIMAWSLGGMVAQALAQKIPEKINSLTLVTSTLRFSQNVNDGWHYAMSDEVLNSFADKLKQDAEKTLKGFIALQFMGVEGSKEVQNSLIKHILSSGKTGQKWGGAATTLSRTVTSAKSVHRFLDDNLGEDSGQKIESNNIPTQEALDIGLTILKEADLRSLTPSCPEHWLFAEYDRLIPKEVINNLISLRPDAEITLLEKAGHAPFITHSEAFLKQVIHFIESQPLDTP